MRNFFAALAVVLAPLIASSAARSEESATQKAVLGASVFCDTPEDISKYVLAAEAGDSASLLSSSDEQATVSCVAAAANYFEREQVRVIQQKVATFRIVRVTIIGVFRHGSLLETRPHDQYLAIRVEGFEV
jgi:hypothetical protein